MSNYAIWHVMKIQVRYHIQKILIYSQPPKQGLNKLIIVDDIEISINLTDCDVASTDSKQGVCIIAKLMPRSQYTSLDQNREKRETKVLFSIKETVENSRSVVKEKG